MVSRIILFLFFLKVHSLCLSYIFAAAKCTRVLPHSIFYVHTPFLQLQDALKFFPIPFYACTRCWESRVVSRSFSSWLKRVHSLCLSYNFAAAKCTRVLSHSIFYVHTPFLCSCKMHSTSSPFHSMCAHAVGRAESCPGSFSSWLKKKLIIFAYQASPTFLLLQDALEFFPISFSACTHCWESRASKTYHAKVLSRG
jgi:hypothetical protein